jgi:EAL domain-containing protein (putative c-di-GMP-specific phosphodiesterase class I)
MATLAQPPAAVGVPWLEHFPTDGGPAQKTLLGKLPFTIGRNDACDLPIRSNRVSREHAAVIRTGDAFRIRDLDSTNGTFLNGQRIEEATLTDGDVVVFADVEFRFFSGATEARRTTVTQVIGFREREPAGKASGPDLVRALRRLQESLLQASARLDYLPWVDLPSGQVAGFEAVLAPAGSDPAAETERSVLAASSRLAARIRDSQWLVAARAVSRLPGAWLAVKIEAPDVAAEACQESLARLADALSGERLVALVPDSLVIDMPHFHEFHGRLRRLGVRLAYGDFAAGKAQFEVHRRAPPDLVKLARSMLKNLSADAERQRQVATVVRTCREVGAEVIAADVSTDEEARICRELGCRYASGSHWGGPLPVVPEVALRPPAVGRKRSATTAFSP